MTTTMRDAFLDKLYNIAKEDRQVILLSGDFGAPSLDKFRKDLTGQFVHTGIAEQNMVNIAAGLALGGKTVFMYAIAPFITLRCYEQIKVNLCCMKLSVTGLGVGAGYGYDTAGPTHHATEDVAIMRALPGMTVLVPSDNVMVAALAEMAYKNPGPKYIRFDREKLPLIYDPNHDFSDGLTRLKTGRDLTIIATGIMVHQAFKVAEELAKHSIDAGIIDLYRIKPVNQELLLKLIGDTGKVVTLEENLINGGIGSVVAEILVDSGKTVPLKRIAIPDQYCFEYGGRHYLHAATGLDVDSVTRTIIKWLQ
jgi:transketolase